MRSSAAFSWLTGSFGFIRYFSEGTWSARGSRCPTGAFGSICWSEFIDGVAAKFGERVVCAIARTADKDQQRYRRDQRSHDGLPVEAPSHDHGEGKPDHKVRRVTF
jgi:hypothetical protein